MQTVRFKNELERNITIKLGYANAKIYKCEDDRCPRPMCYKYVCLYGRMNFDILFLFQSLWFIQFAGHTGVEKRTVLFVMCQDLRMLE